jgi:hypothetical protein
VLVGEAVLAFAAEDMGDDLCDVLSGQLAFQEEDKTYTQSDRSEFMIRPDGKWEDALLLRLLRVQQDVLGVEASPTDVDISHTAGNKLTISGGS